MPLLVWCTAPPPLTLATLPGRTVAVSLIDSVCQFKASGEIKFSVRGERHSAGIDVVWRSDSDFTIALYSLLGGTVASVATDSSGAWIITAGDSILRKHGGDRVSLGGMLDYSLTFKEFLLAATGRFLDSTIMKTPCDSLLIRGKKAFLYWPEAPGAGRAFEVTAVIDRKHFSITDVIYAKKDSALWSLATSLSKKGAPEEIRFKDRNNNYFYLKYGTVIVKRGSNCRTERL